MTTIIEGMTPAQFVTALNSNFTELNALLGDIGDMITVTASNYITAVNSNLMTLNAFGANTITINSIITGEAGRNVISNLNSNSTGLSGSLSETITYENTIHVSNAGNDVSGDGTIGNPYQTLAKVSTILQNSTKVLLHKGDMFSNDKLDASGKVNIAVDSYSTGIAPIITGLKGVTGWTNEGGNIWSKQDNNFPDEITNVFIGGTKALIARTAGWKTATGGSGTTLVDSNLTDADGYWDGAEIYIVKDVWLVHFCRVSTYLSKTFTIPQIYLDPELVLFPYSITAGSTYFIQNHRNCLTTANTWAYNNSTKTLYIYSIAEPANVTATYGSDCIYVDGGNGLYINNISIDKSQKHAININDVYSFSIDSITTDGSGYHSIFARNSNKISITNNTFTDQNDDGITLLQCVNISITDNIINKCAYIQGTERELPYDPVGQAGNGILATLCENLTIQYNEIKNTGLNGIIVTQTRNPLIQYNYVHLVGLNRQDCGAIYISNRQVTSWFIARGLPDLVMDGGKILNNIVTEGKTSAAVEGLYLDIDSFNVEVAYNYVTGYKWNIEHNGGNLNNIHDNTLVNLQAPWQTYIILNSASCVNNIINNNLFVNSVAAQFCIVITEVTYPETITNNKYYYPFGKNPANEDAINVCGTNMTLAQWVADESRVVWTRTGEEEISPSTHVGSEKPATDFVVYLTNPAKTVRTVTEAELPYNDYLDMDGNVQTYPFNIPAYGSKILVRPN